MKYEQYLVNVATESTAVNLLNNVKIKREISNIELKLNGSGRVLVRCSGTENVVRVMVEGKDKNYTRKSAKKLASIIKKVS